MQSTLVFFMNEPFFVVVSDFIPLMLLILEVNLSAGLEKVCWNKSKRAHYQ